MDRLKSSSLTITSTKNNLGNSSSNTKFTNSTTNKYDPLSKNSGNHISFQTLINQKSQTPKETNHINNNDNLANNNPIPTFQNNITENNSKINKNYSKDEDSTKRQSMKNINTLNNGKNLIKFFFKIFPFYYLTFMLFYFQIIS